MYGHDAPAGIGGASREVAFAATSISTFLKTPFSGMRDLSYPQVMNADLKIVDSRMSRVVTKIPRLGRYLLGAAVAILASTIIYQGLRMFPESTFQLASESRLPKWITLPPGLTRSDVSIKMSYFTWPRA